MAANESMARMPLWTAFIHQKCCGKEINPAHRRERMKGMFRNHRKVLKEKVNCIEKHVLHESEDKTCWINKDTRKAWTSLIRFQQRKMWKEERERKWKQKEEVLDSFSDLISFDPESVSSMPFETERERRKYRVGMRQRESYIWIEWNPEKRKTTRRSVLRARKCGLRGKTMERKKKKWKEPGSKNAHQEFREREVRLWIQSQNMFHCIDVNVTDTQRTHGSGEQTFHCFSVEWDDKMKKTGIWIFESKPIQNLLAGFVISQTFLCVHFFQILSLSSVFARQSFFLLIYHIIFRVSHHFRVRDSILGIGYIQVPHLNWGREEREKSCVRREKVFVGKEREKISGNVWGCEWFSDKKEKKRMKSGCVSLLIGVGDLTRISVLSFPQIGKRKRKNYRKEGNQTCEKRERKNQKRWRERERKRGW